MAFACWPRGELRRFGKALWWPEVVGLARAGVDDHLRLVRTQEAVVWKTMRFGMELKQAP